MISAWSAEHNFQESPSFRDILLDSRLSWPGVSNRMYVVRTVGALFVSYLHWIPFFISDKPKFKCDADWVASLYQPSLNISCLVVADPPVNHTHLHWGSDDGNKTMDATDNDLNLGGKHKGFIANVEPGVS